MAAADTAGLDTIARTLAQAAADLEDVDDTGRRATEDVADVARRRAPRRTGRLAGSIDVEAAGAGSWTVTASTTYVRPVHFGVNSGRRHIRAQPFLYDALTASLDDIGDAFDQRAGAALDLIRGS